MKRPATALVPCPLCGKQVSPIDLTPGELLRPAMVALIQGKHPNWTPSERLCASDLDRVRAEYVQHLLAEERGDLSELDQQVVNSMREHELLAADPDAAFERAQTAGERWSDRISGFGGSWTFIALFGAVLAVWIGVNALPLLRSPFDPYPYILLNLVLSCIAAIQAPIILMSQNRQEAKDRLRAQHDYKINLKAELEIRLLSERFDRLIAHQWQRLLEIQQVQLDLMEDLARRNRPGGA